MDYGCIRGHTFAHEIGHLQGAGHNKDFESFGNPSYTNSAFSYGHGWYELPLGKRTIMSFDCDNVPATLSNKNESCRRNGIWSDPYDSFIGSASPAGTESDNWNAKVLFATGPYVASLRGPEQNYDSVQPRGTISLPVTTIVRGALLDVTATFDEEIHVRYPPHLTIADSTTSTTTKMTKSTNKIYTLSHTLSDEIGTVNVSFSNARDIYGNPIIATPTSGSTFIVIKPDQPPVISALNNIAIPASTTRTIPVTASDLDGDPIILRISGASFATISGNTITLSPGNSDAGSYTITVTATANGLVDTESFRVIITNPVDTTLPVLTVPSDKTFEATGIQTPLSVSDIGTATATDNTDPNLTITNNAPASFPVGTTTITYTATDDSGNSASADQRITIQDTTPPQFTTTLQDMTVTTDDNSIIVSFDIPTATDIFPVTVSCDHFSGASFRIGATLVTCTATDDNSNSAVTSSTFTVIRSTPAQTSIIDDSFNSTLDSWSFQEKPNTVANQQYCRAQNTNIYSLTHNSNHGGSALTNYSNTCWFGLAGGVKSFEIPSAFDGGNLSISLDYRSIADLLSYTHIGHVNNMFYVVSDSDDNVLSSGTIFQGIKNSAIKDTNWNDFTINISVMGSSVCPCELYVFTNDSWSAEWKKQIYFDNVNSMIVPSASGASDVSDVSIPPNTLKQDELFGMLFANNTKILINTKQVYDNSILIKWDEYDDTSNDYKVVISTSSDPRDKSGYIVNDTEYRFINLQPDTQYNVAVGVRAHDSTQSILKIKTALDGMMHFDSKLVLSAQINQDSETISLSWIDSNGIGENRYRIERSINNGTFELTALSPRYDTNIDDEINPEWYGQTVSYKIFERIGEQKLFSNEITVTIPLR